MIVAVPKDVEGTSILDGISGIPDVINFSAPAGEWVNIVTQSDTKNFILQSRGEVTWYYSASEDGDYFTFRNGAALQSRFVSTSGTSIGWGMMDAEGVFELLSGR
jgi:hypothetical protein